jgi:hypothetical protein
MIIIKLRKKKEKSVIRRKIIMLIINVYERMGIKMGKMKNKK